MTEVQYFTVLRSTLSYLDVRFRDYDISNSKSYVQELVLPLVLPTNFLYCTYTVLYVLNPTRHKNISATVFCFAIQSSDLSQFRQVDGSVESTVYLKILFDALKVRWHTEYQFDLKMAFYNPTSKKLLWRSLM